MLPENLNVELKQAPSGRWTATGAAEHGEGRSQAEALRAWAAKLEQRECARAELRKAFEASHAEAAEHGTDALTEEEIAAEVRALREGK